MDDTTAWKYCVVGNIIRTHIDDNGILRNGTPAYPGGTRVYLCGKYWDPTRKEISVIGLTRGKRYQVHEVPIALIENVRCARVYKPRVLAMMNNWEFYDCWWDNTKKDKESTEAFVENWHASAHLKQITQELRIVGRYTLLTQFIPWLKEDEIGGWVFDKENDGAP